MPCCSANNSVLSQVSNGAVPLTAIGSNPMRAAPTASVFTGFRPAIRRPGGTGLTARIKGPRRDEVGYDSRNPIPAIARRLGVVLRRRALRWLPYAAVHDAPPPVRREAGLIHSRTLSINRDGRGAEHVLDGKSDAGRGMLLHLADGDKEIAVRVGVVKVKAVEDVTASRDGEPRVLLGAAQHRSEERRGGKEWG